MLSPVVVFRVSVMVVVGLRFDERLLVTETEDENELELV